MIVIGFGYKARNGKDYCVETIIKERAGAYDVRRYSFAQELKREVNEAALAADGMEHLINRLRSNGTLPSWVEYDQNPDMTDPDCPLGKQRKLLQWWGTDYRRNADPFYWVAALRKRILAERPQVALISDVRFPNEVLWIKSPEIGGYVVKVTRTGFVDPQATGHTSEKILDGYKFDIDIECADGDLSGLRQSALEAFDYVMRNETIEVPDFTLKTLEKELEETANDVH